MFPRSSAFPVARAACATFAFLVAAAAHAGADRLKSEASAFLRQNAASPVDWHPWSAEVLARAKAEGRPVYVFIGSFLHELSRATARQSHANADNAALLNKNFVCVIVDREERPDVAALAQAYLRAVRQTGGWPANLWLTPDLVPYEGDAYLPPTEEWGKRGFIKVAAQAAETWAADPERCRSLAEDARNAMSGAEMPPGAGLSGDALKQALAGAAEAWRAEADPKRGAFGAAPAAIDPELVRFLLARGGEDRDAALGVLRGLLASAARDPVDGGFFRYTIDPDGHVPLLQKTLADQARLALALLEAGKASGDAAFSAAARGALDYALGRLRLADGSFAAAEDATAEEHAGYFTWSEAEIDAALGADAAAVKTALGVQAGGNVSAETDQAGRYRGRNFLRGAVAAGVPAGALEKLRAARDLRPAPPRDERATSGAHGLLLAALATAAAELREPRYLDAARELYATIGRDFVQGGDTTLRRLRASDAPASAADYAAVALGCAGLARVANVAKADELADRVLARAAGLFLDGERGRYFAAPQPLPVGQFYRALALDEAPHAEALALLAGLPGDDAARLTRGLADYLEQTPSPAGDMLLALARE